MLLIKPMQESDIRTAVELIADAMNPFEAELSRQAFDFYFSCKLKDIESARDYYTAWRDGILCGLVGLHHFRWGPPANVWLSWFAVHPDFQRQRIGSQLIDYIQGLAVKSGYTKLLVETYDSDDFAIARTFYQQQGFEKIGRINNYIDDEIAMLVYGKRI